MLWYVASVTLSLSHWREMTVYLGNKPSEFQNYRALAKKIMQEMNGRRVIIRTIKADSGVKFWFKCGKRKFNIVPPTLFQKSYERGRMKHP